jgi:hypothetical protein
MFHDGRLRRAFFSKVFFFWFTSGFLCSTAVHAQDAVANDAVIEAGNRVTASTQANPAPKVTAQELLGRQAALAETHLSGPPLRTEPDFVRRSSILPATDVPRLPPKLVTRARPSAQTPDQSNTGESQSAAPGAMTYFLTHDQGSFAGELKSNINEPAVANAGSNVFVTSNWDAAYSTDGGNTFALVNPYSIFPSMDGGFCCDQTAIYDHTRDIVAWSLLYIKSGSTSLDKGGWRTAFAHSSSVASGNWCYWNWHTDQFGLASNGFWLDYPDVALSNGFIYYTSNIFTTAGNAFYGTVVWRIPLDALNSALNTCGSFTYSYFVVTDHFTFTLVQGATATMYWASHNSTNSIRIYNWPDNSNQISSNDVAVTTWFNGTRSCPGPDGLNWCGRADGDHGKTGWVANGVIGFMWSSAAGGGRNWPYIRVARFNESNRTLINEPDIWNPNFAWIYNAIGVDDRGHIAGTVFYGGGANYPTMATIIWDDLSATPPPWEIYNVVASSAGATAWGDFYTSRRHGTYGNTWVTAGEYRLANGNTDTYYVWFGRQRDAPASQTNYNLSVTTSGNGTVTSSPSGINCSSNTGTCSYAFASGTSVQLTASPASGWTFSGWSGAGCSGTGGCSVNMTQNTSVGATFTQQTYTLTVSAFGSGTVTSTPSGINCGATCSANFSSGTQVTLNATPAAGWTFAGWSGACSGTSCIVTMNSAVSVTATFTQQTPTCSLSANPSTINLEQKSTLSWTSANATGGSISPGIGSVGPSGQTTVMPSQTTTYTGTFTGPGGVTACSTTVTVNSGSGGGPSIASNKRRRRI